MADLNVSMVVGTATSKGMRSAVFIDNIYITEVGYEI